TLYRTEFRLSLVFCPCSSIYRNKFLISLILCPITNIYRTNFPDFTILCPIPSVYRTKFLLSAFLCPITSMYRTSFLLSAILCPIPSIYRTSFLLSAILCPIPSIYRTNFPNFTIFCPISGLPPCHSTESPTFPSSLSTLTSPTISIYICPVFNIDWLVIVSRHALYNYIDHYVILKITKMEVLQMGILSVVTPMIAIFLAIVTRRVIISLFISIWVGGMFYPAGEPFSVIGSTVTWMKYVMIDDWNARFFVLTALLGVGAAFMYKTGGSEGLIRLLEDKLTTKRRVLFLPYILGILVFFNDYANSVIVGNASKDITGKNKVSREKLAYVLDATSAPMATIGPVSDWIGYQVSIIAGAFAAVSITGIEPYYAFLQSIPWNFYSILSLAAVGMFIVMGRD